MRSGVSLKYLDTSQKGRNSDRMSRLFTSAVILSGAVCVGYGMWSLISPGEERKKELLKNLPEANPLRMEESRRKNALMLQVLKEAAETNDNVLARYASNNK